MSQWQQLAVLGLGSLLGFICKGATGFGSAVMLVASWVVANLAGVDAGQAFSWPNPARNQEATAAAPYVSAK